jgi:hypothetical protein
MTTPKIWAGCVLFIKFPEDIHISYGEKSPNLVTLPLSQKRDLNVKESKTRAVEIQRGVKTDSIQGDQIGPIFANSAIV